ncbi:MAG: hypothetical protein U1F43_09330 [Myxococcota bacterium]
MTPADRADGPDAAAPPDIGAALRAVLNDPAELEAWRRAAQAVARGGIALPGVAQDDLARFASEMGAAVQALAARNPGVPLAQLADGMAPLALATFFRGLAAEGRLMVAALPRAEGAPGRAGVTRAWVGEIDAVAGALGADAAVLLARALARGDRSQIAAIAAGLPGEADAGARLRARAPRVLAAIALRSRMAPARTMSRQSWRLALSAVIALAVAALLAARACA